MVLPPIQPVDDRSQLIRDHMPLVELVVQRMALAYHQGNLLELIIEYYTAEVAR